MANLHSGAIDPRRKLHFSNVIWILQHIFKVSVEQFLLFSSNIPEHLRSTLTFQDLGGALSSPLRFRDTN